MKNNKNTRMNNNNPSKKKKGRFKAFLWQAWCILFVLIFIGSLGVGVLAIMIYKDAMDDLPVVDATKVITQPNSIVLDANDEVVDDLAEDASIIVTKENLPAALVDAFSAIEDARFLVHKGIDGPRTIKAVLGTYILRTGDSGGSTISQQVVKNTLLADKIAREGTDYKNSPKRKIDEWLLTYELEKVMSKEEIFMSYLNNVVTFGRFTGVGTAAKRFYNKDISELTLGEAALLAGIPQLPYENNPFHAIDSATERYQVVIDQMYYHNYITVEQRDALKYIPLSDLLTREHENSLNENLAFFSAVQLEIEELGIYETQEEGAPLYYRNLKIFTTLNREQQDFANYLMETNEAIDWNSSAAILYGDGMTQEENYNFQGAFTVVNTKTGAIPAIGASRNIREDGYNIAIEGARSPGSSIKPIIDYAPVVEEYDWGVEHVMNDRVTYYSGTNSQVFNYNGGDHAGFVTMQYALAQSLNTTAVQAMQLVGAERAGEIAGKMGISKAAILSAQGTLPEAAALGGGLEVTTKELAGAYATLGNGGYYNKPHTIRRIETMDGEVIYDYATANPSKQVIKESTAATITQALIHTRWSGTPASGRKQVSGDITFAAKTGTSSYSGDEIADYGVPRSAEKDHWIVGYSPEYTIATWTGLAVEDAETLIRTRGNVNANKDVGSYMMATWINQFSPSGTSFSFLGAQNSDSKGGIGSFTVSNNHNTSTVSWTNPGITYPAGFNDEDKKAVGDLIFDVVINTSHGDYMVQSGVRGNSVNYAGYSLFPGITGLTVSARMSSEKADMIMSAVSVTVSASTKEIFNNDKDKDKENEEEEKIDDETNENRDDIS